MNTVGPPTTSMIIALVAFSSSTSSYKKSGKRNELRLQQQQFWAFVQKLSYSRIGSSCSEFKWITAILYKLSMAIWTLWQFHTDGVYLLSSAWQLMLGVLHYIYLARSLFPPTLIVLYLLNFVVALL